MSHWGVVIEQLTHEDQVVRDRRLRRRADRRRRSLEAVHRLSALGLWRARPVGAPRLRGGAR